MHIQSEVIIWKEQIIRTYSIWRGDKSWQTLNNRGLSNVENTALSGLDL